MLEEEYSDKQYYIPYTRYEKEKTRKYRNDPTKLVNWFYDEKGDYHLDQNGVRFNFKYYSQRQVRYNPNWQYLKEKAKNKQKKTVNQLKLRVRLIVFWHLGVSFPDTF